MKIKYIEGRFVQMTRRISFRDIEMSGYTYRWKRRGCLSSSYCRWHDFLSFSLPLRLEEQEKEQTRREMLFYEVLKANTLKENFISSSYIRVNLILMQLRGNFERESSIS